ncbi:MAG: glyoxalase/bleomycin resistance/dioxygenase family protein [Candidatus Delongbacteria bacterium]|nr:glyoxalase/bleomycin resistance/dioxygenase family protein [Candidatus Delongbacteria bacterium]
MGFKSTILVVEDVKKSRKLYEDILMCEVVDDFGEYNVGFEGGLALYKKTLFIDLTAQEDIVLKANNLTVYFEFKNIESIEILIKEQNFEFVHNIQEQPWGQNVFRFYDYDGHMIEIAEEMDSVLLRLQNMGMSFKEISEKTGYTEDKVITDLEKIREKK